MFFLEISEVFILRNPDTDHIEYVPGVTTFPERKHMSIKSRHCTVPVFPRKFTPDFIKLGQTRNSQLFRLVERRNAPVI